VIVFRNPGYLVAMKRGNSEREMLHLITCEATMVLVPGETTIGELEDLRGRREGKRSTYTQMTVVAVGDFVQSAKTMWENHRSMGMKDCSCRTKLEKMLSHYQERWKDTEVVNIYPQLKMMVTQEMANEMERFRLSHMEETITTYGS
jgi:3-oxoacyl-(acyl-carrier-protein) synthase